MSGQGCRIARSRRSLQQIAVQTKSGGELLEKTREVHLDDIPHEEEHILDLAAEYLVGGVLVQQHGLSGPNLLAGDVLVFNQELAADPLQLIAGKP